MGAAEREAGSPADVIDDPTRRGCRRESVRGSSPDETLPSKDVAGAPLSEMRAPEDVVDAAKDETRAPEDVVQAGIEDGRSSAR